MQDYESMRLFLKDAQKLYGEQNINVPEKYFNATTNIWEIRK
ncbi:MAG: hypothetical protein OEX22_06305 [Cyclobacteriaceae bacterium]|nr:hypothetical protein [Cyclobacteriaceae bacterium]